MLWLSVLLLHTLGCCLAFLIVDRGYIHEQHYTFKNRTHHGTYYSVSGESSDSYYSKSYYTAAETGDFVNNSEDRGPLILTPYIEEGNIEEGRRAARVSPLLGSIESYSGYFTVNKKYDSNLFFWYFPAEETPGDAPVILWLNGGPGMSSMYGLLYENGPLALQCNGTLAKRSINWSNQYHMIYIDNPVGVGYSFTKKKGLVHNEAQLSKQMHFALAQFFLLFPDLSKNEFFVAGESYAGRYVPLIAYEIHRMNLISKIQINLKGVMIGNGVVDMEFFGKKGLLLAEIGLYDLRLLPERLEHEMHYVKALKSQNYDLAKKLQLYLESEISSIKVNPYNYIDSEEYENAITNCTASMNELFNNSPIRTQIHVGNVPYSALNGDVNEMMWEGDGFMNTSPIVQTLLEHYHVLYYNGQLDLMLPYPNCEEYADKLNWSGSSEFRKARRNNWIVDGKLAGFSRSGGNLTLVHVRDAGHMVPTDQPEWALDLITKFVNDREVV